MSAYRVLCIIAARSGSKGLRHKNVRKLDGVPLLVRAIELAQQSARRGEKWDVVVSTNSSSYARTARGAGARIASLRPQSLAQDDSRLIDTIVHTLGEVDVPANSFDAVVMLSATTPLTLPRDVREALRMFREGGGVSVASVARDPYAPSWRFELAEGVMTHRVNPADRRVRRRQEHPAQVALNGAIYIASPVWLRHHGQFVQRGRTLGLVMPKRRCLDIEDKQDLELAKILLAGQSD